MQGVNDKFFQNQKDENILEMDPETNSMAENQEPGTQVYDPALENEGLKEISKAFDLLNQKEKLLYEQNQIGIQ